MFSWCYSFVINNGHLPNQLEPTKCTNVLRLLWFVPHPRSLFRAPEWAENASAVLNWQYLGKDEIFITDLCLFLVISLNLSQLASQKQGLYIGAVMYVASEVCKENGKNMYAECVQVEANQGLWKQAGIYKIMVFAVSISLQRWSFYYSFFMVTVTLGVFIKVQGFTWSETFRICETFFIFSVNYTYRKIITQVQQ